MAPSFLVPTTSLMTGEEVLDRAFCIALGDLAGICRDNQCAEIYHPLTGEIYGGLQEECPGEPEKYLLWKSCARQRWSASGYVRMILMGMFGLHFDTSGITFRPTLLAQCKKIILRNLPYCAMNIGVEVYGSGQDLLACTVNGQTVTTPVLPVYAEGDQHIVMQWGKSSERER